MECTQQQPAGPVWQGFQEQVILNLKHGPTVKLI